MPPQPSTFVLIANGNWRVGNTFYNFVYLKGRGGGAFDSLCQFHSISFSLFQAFCLRWSRCRRYVVFFCIFSHLELLRFYPRAACHSIQSLTLRVQAAAVVKRAHWSFSNAVLLTLYRMSLNCVRNVFKMIKHTEVKKPILTKWHVLNYSPSKCLWSLAN